MQELVVAYWQYDQSFLIRKKTININIESARENKIPSEFGTVWYNSSFQSHRLMIID